MPSKKKKVRQEKQKKRRGKKAKRKSWDCCVEKFCFLRLPELCKLIFLMWVRRPRKYWQPASSASLWYVLAFIAGQWLENRSTTVWHEIFAGRVYFCGVAIFCALRKLIFAIRTDWLFSRGIHFCDLQKVPNT